MSQKQKPHIRISLAILNQAKHFVLDFNDKASNSIGHEVERINLGSFADYAFQFALKNKESFELFIADKEITDNPTVIDIEFPI